MRIAIDAMGGDHAPGPIVEGALDALATDPELSLLLIGDQDQIEPFVDVDPETQSRLETLHTPEHVSMQESPAKALRSKPRSSINLCWKALSEGKVDGLISAGNTGAVVGGGLFTRRYLKGIRKPGIAVTMPSPTGWSVMLDVGANANPKPEHLFHYGVMGSIFAKQMLGCEDPTIGLLSIGAEEGKGNELSKQTALLFQNSPIRENFRGNIEGRDVCRGLVDVIVCDGFVGNIVLKCCEGMVDFLLHTVSHELLGTLDSERDVAKHALINLHNRYHHSEFGGAPLLGIDGVCLICHGGSDSRAIGNAVRAAKRHNVVNKMIVKEMEIAFATSAAK